MVCLVNKMAIPSLSKLTNKPISQPVYAYDGKSLGMPRRWGSRSMVMIVPSTALNAFVEMMFTARLQDLWYDHAHDMLAQYDGVMEGDWEAAGISLDVEFPIIDIIANDFGAEWEAYVARRDDISTGTQWHVSDMIGEEDFDNILTEHLEGWRDELDTKQKVQVAIAKLQTEVRNKIAEDAEDGEDSADDE